MSQNGKGNGPRKGYDHRKYAENYDAIFRKPPKKLKQGIYCIGREDEMVTFHEDGVYLDTFYARCPEHAIDFVKHVGDRTFQTKKDLIECWDQFAATWKTKYDEPDEY